MTDPRPPFTVRAGGGDSGMPPLGPPSVTPSDRPPSPHYPPRPPDQWPTPPPLLPSPAPAPPRGPRWSDRVRRPAFAWGAIAVVAAILAGALVGWSTNSDRASTAVAPTTTQPRRLPPSSSSGSGASSSGPASTTTTTNPQDLDAVVNDIERFVERERGLKYKNTVEVRLAGEGDFQQLLLKDFDKERAGLTEQGEVLSALGLVTNGEDIVSDSRSMLEIGVVGFYDPETKQLVVRGTSISPYVREVLAHELTHALDDQWFDLNRPQLDNVDDETDFGFLALTEGNARRIENAYLASLSDEEQTQAVQEQQELISEHPELFSLPRILLTLLQAPYDDGLSFVQSLLSSGGQQALDHAFSSPPVTSEQILQPAKFVAGEGPFDVPPPTPEGTASNVGVLGELLLQEMLSDSPFPSVDVTDAVRGWGGDKYVTWRSASGASCLRDTFVGDTTGDTSELIQAITSWADDHNGSVNTNGGGPATLTVCSS